jgi:hypothetical protein
VVVRINWIGVAVVIVVVKEIRTSD